MQNFLGLFTALDSPIQRTVIFQQPVYQVSLTFEALLVNSWTSSQQIIIKANDTEIFHGSFPSQLQ